MYCKEVKPGWWLYILCTHDVTPSIARTDLNAKFYTGISNEPRRRLHEHNGGFCKATRGRRWYPLIAIKCGPQLLAARIERWMKTGNTRHKRDNALLFAELQDTRFFAARPFLTMFEEEWVTWQNTYVKNLSPNTTRCIAYYNHLTGQWQRLPMTERSLAPLMEREQPK